MSTSRSVVQFKSQLGLIAKFVQEVLPQVESELDRWRAQVRVCPEGVLAAQAAASISSKRFHAQGGSIYALYPGVDQKGFTRFVVALQTISDYLDNLCDRAGVADEAGFRQLHLAMEEALIPDRPVSDYYCLYPHSNDGGYLESLVRECRQQVSRWPAYALVRDEVVELARLYSELQTYKHLLHEIREGRMVQWTQPYLEESGGLSCWEFAAAAGSTLGIFALCASAANPGLTAGEVQKIKQAYFPWVCGLHILLDYFIDQQEDRDGGDLNFIFYYLNDSECEKRLTWFLETAVRQIAELEHPLFHRTVLEGLLALYLSDPKAAQGEVRAISRNLLRTGGRRAGIMHGVCRILRWRKTI